MTTEKTTENHSNGMRAAVDKDAAANVSPDDARADVTNHEHDAEHSQPASSSKPPRPNLELLAVIAIVGVIAVGLGVAGASIIKKGANRALGLLGGGGHHVTTTDATTSAGQLWQCPMHPWVILSHPGTSPCGMNLVPVDPAKLSNQVVIDPVVVQNMGVRVQPVVSGPVERTVRTVGTVTYDETKVADVNAKTAGWIQKIDVDYEGQSVKRGQPLFDLYSPDLYAAQEEYLQAYRNRDKIKSDFLPQAAKGASNLLQAARTRLKYFDISDEQIQKLRQTGKPTKTLTIDSPYTGVVVDKHAMEGMRVKPGMRLYRIADLSTVWVMATVYEYQLPFVREGQEAVMTLAYLPGRTFRGKVSYIYPYLNGKSRQIKVRIAFDNPDGVLKPGMFANVKLRATVSPHDTLVPRAAILDTGERKVAFVSLGNGRFEPRDVKTGVETEGGMVQVLSGLTPGDQVVTSGQFLIDSEAKMRASLAKMTRGTPPATHKGGADGAGKMKMEMNH